MRPANAIVRVDNPSADGVAHAIKMLKRKLERSGLMPLVFRQESRLYAYQSPGKKLRIKRAAARRREWRKEFRKAQRDLEFGGDNATRRTYAAHARRVGASESYSRRTSPASAAAA